MSHQFFIGIDSDGTAFDSMTVKHRKAFIPAMIGVWQLDAYADKVRDICEDINLRGPTRGIDRFSGLQVTFERFAAAGIPVPDYSALDGFLRGGKLSNAALREYMREHKDGFLDSLLEWSRQADEIFQHEMELQPPFKGVLPALKKAYPFADIAVISSASESSLAKDWQKDGLLNYVAKVYGQEFGGKKAQLKTAVTGKYHPENVLMIGDAVGDMQAAESVGAWFYPMLPGREEESWQKLTDIWLDKFLSGGFDSEIQQELLKDFIR